MNLLRIDLYDVVKEIKKGRDTMKTIIKKKYTWLFKEPCFVDWLDYYSCQYVSMSVIVFANSLYQTEWTDHTKYVALEDADVMDGYIPTSDDKERRREWEDTIKETLMDTSKNGFGFSRQEADHVMKEIQNMDVKTASEFFGIPIWLL